MYIDIWNVIATNLCRENLLNSFLKVLYFLALIHDKESLSIILHLFLN